MAVVWVRLHGSLPSHCAEEGADRGDGISVTFPQEKVNMEEVFDRLHIPEEAVSFVAINGMKCAKDTWLTDGDKVAIFPFVTGG
jgi:molybdopterin converting factor small subunit